MQCVCVDVVSCVNTVKSLKSFFFFLHKVSVGPSRGASAQMGVQVGVYVRPHRERWGRRGFHCTRGRGRGWDLEANISHTAAVGKMTLEMGLRPRLGLCENWAS